MFPGYTIYVTELGTRPVEYSNKTYCDYHYSYLGIAGGRIKLNIHATRKQPFSSKGLPVYATPHVSLHLYVDSGKGLVPASSSAVSFRDLNSDSDVRPWPREQKRQV